MNLGQLFFVLHLYFALSLVFVSAQKVENFETKLRDELFVKRHIDTHTRPVQQHNDTVHLEFGLNIIHIIELNEKTSVLSLNAWMRMVWTDSNFNWNPAEYGDLKLLRVDPGTIWKPDLVLYNNAKAGNPEIYGEANALIYDNGQVFWVPPSTLHTICDIDVHDYPFDVQDCEIKFGSWTQDGTLINISPYRSETEVISDLATEHNEWKILSVSEEKKDIFYPCCKEPYPVVKYHVKLQRRSPYYQFTLLVPSVLTMILTLAVFWLPPPAAERIILSCFNFLMQLMLLIHIYWVVPRNGSSVPAIVKFNGCSIVFIALSVILSVISIHLSRSRYLTPVPVYLRNLLSDTVGKLLCIDVHQHKLNHDTGLLQVSGAENGKHNSSESATKEFTDWQIVTVAVNRVLFLVYILVYIIIICASFF